MFPFPFSYIAPSLVEESSFAFKIVVPSGADQTVQLLTQLIGSGQPNTTIDWGEGAGIESLTITNPSNTFSPGAYTIRLNIGTNSGPIDRFRVDSGEALVTEVVRWGVNPWKSLANAFQNCVNLTTIGTSDFTGSSLSTGTDLNSCFEACTSLTTVDARTWNLSTGAQLDSFVKECESLTDLYLPTAIPRRGSWSEAFRQVGTAVTAGCNFHLGSLDFTGTTSSYSMANLFSFSRINPSSDLTDWNFGSNAIKTSNASYMFRDVALTGVDSTLDVSGWSTFNAQVCTGMFYGVNRRDDIAAASGITIEEYSLDISNLNTSSCTTVSGMFANTGTSDDLGLKAMTGLSTLPASTTVTSMETFMAYQNNLALNASDNFSDAFMNSIAPTSLYFAFRRLGFSISTPANYGAAPNLASLDLSNLTAMTGIFREGRYSSNFDFSNVTFPTAQIKADTLFFNTYFSNSDSSLNFSAAMNIGGVNAMLNSFKFCVVRELTFGNNVDFSGCETFREAFRQMKGSEDADADTVSINLPTNMSFAGINTAANNSFGLAFTNTKGTGSTGTTASAWNALDSCNTNNLLRRLKATLDTPGSDTDIVLNNCKYSGPSTVVSSQYDELITNGWTFGTLASETPYILYTSPFLASSNITPVINTTGGTFSSSNSNIPINATTGVINTANEELTTIKYTLADGCYNEQIIEVGDPYEFQFTVTGDVTILAQPNTAGSFTIEWQDGTTQTSTGSTSIASPTGIGAGNITINKRTDATWCDQFKIVSGQANVTEVVSWGKNPWVNLDSAFLNCTNLTDISTTSLITGVSCYLTSAFRSCTSLSSANISSWNMTNAARIDQMFDACTGLEVMETGSLNLNLNHTSQFWLRSTGTAVTDGCEYKMSGLNITATSYAAGLMTNWFYSMKINPSSSFANISWPSITHARATFIGSSITGISSTLDCSGWTNYNSASFPYFGSLTATEGGTSNMKINITNLSVSSVTSFNRSFLSSNVSEIIGLNSLGASAGITNMEYAFYLCGFLSFSNSNFSNAFINSFSLTNVPTQAFRGVGGSLSSGSAPPNLGSLNISGVSSLTQMFQSAKFSSAPDFSNVVMSTTNPYSFNSCFSGMAILDNSNMDSLFAKTFKVSSFASTFNGCQISSVTIGNNVDLSTCTTFNRAFISASTISDVSFPTNADFSGVTTSTDWQYMFTSGPSMSTCSVDNFIRRLHATALSYGLVINFNNAATTEAPSVVSSKVADLEAAGWTITDNTTDATMPFEYTLPTPAGSPNTPTISTTGGTFSSTNSNVPVDATTGVINTTNREATTIRYTLPDGCYNEQVVTITIAVINNVYSMAFDGANNAFTIDNSSSYLNPAKITISAWFKPSSVVTDSAIVSSPNVFGLGYHTYAIGVNSVGNIRLYGLTTPGGAFSFDATTLGTLNLNQWNHVAMTFDETNFVAYLNGSSASSARTGVLNYQVPTGNVEIGRRAGTTVDVVGSINEVAIFNVAISSAEMTEIYNATSAGKTADLNALATPPIAWYRMGD